MQSRVSGLRRWEAASGGLCEIAVQRRLDGTLRWYCMLDMFMLNSPQALLPPAMIFPNPVACLLYALAASARWIAWTLERQRPAWLRIRKHRPLSHWAEQCSKAPGFSQRRTQAFEQVRALSGSNVAPGELQSVYCDLRKFRDQDRAQASLGRTIPSSPKPTVRSAVKVSSISPEPCDTKTPYLLPAELPCGDGLPHSANLVYFEGHGIGGLLVRAHLHTPEIGAADVIPNNFQLAAHQRCGPG